MVGHNLEEVGPTCVVIEEEDACYNNSLDFGYEGSRFVNYLMTTQDKGGGNHSNKTYAIRNWCIKGQLLVLV
jgi:hypothetical protein